MAGFTLVRDLGSSHNLAISLRDAINRGILLAHGLSLPAKVLPQREGMLTRRMGETTPDGRSWSSGWRCNGVADAEGGAPALQRGCRPD